MNNIKNMVKKSGTSFFWSMRLLPNAKRNAMYTIYAFFRHIDDIVDGNAPLEEKQELIRMALAAREKAYAPYSNFMVGAALRAKDGRIYTGCNVENASFTPTSCAERTALFKAVADGVTEFTDIAVVGSRRGEVNEQITSPCGVCRQALFEFGGPELNVIMAKTPEDFIERSMDELLPFGFGPSNVAGNAAVEK